MDESHYERKKQQLMNLYPDIEEGMLESDEKNGKGCRESDASLEKEEDVATSGNSSATEDDESINSLSTHSEENSSNEKPKRPFWAAKHSTQKTKSTTSKTTNNSNQRSSPDESPTGINPDSVDKDNRVFNFKVILFSSLLLVSMATAIIVLSLLLVKQKKSDSNSEEPTVNLPTPTGEGVGSLGGPCDISDVEFICALEENQDRELDLERIPKCIQDTFNLVYVRAGHDNYYQLHSIESLRSCSSEGMALKRLAAREHEKPTAGLLSCQYTAYKWYYEFGQMEWWTESGAMQTDICERDDVSCFGEPPNLQVQDFENDLGDLCMLSTLSL